MERPAARPLSWPERIVVIVDATVGGIVTALAGLLFAVSIGDEGGPGDPHGGSWGVLTAVLFAPSGLLLLLAAVGMARRWRGRWWLHLLPLLAPLGIYALFMVAMGVVLSWNGLDG